MTPGLDSYRYHLAREVQVLLAVAGWAARPSGDRAAAQPGSPAADTTLRALRAAVAGVDDWALLQDVSLRASLFALTQRALSTTCADLVPAEIAAQWSSLALFNGQRALTMSRQLLEIVTAFRRAGVPILPIKGPLSAEELYGDATLRSCVDLDVVVCLQDLDAAREVLTALGYERMAAGSSVADEVYTAAEQEMVFHRRRLSAGAGMVSDPPVELHWRVGFRFDSVSVDGCRLVARSRQGQLLGKPVPSPSFEDAVLIPVVHASSHGWENLEQVTLVAAALRRLGDDSWPALQSHAREEGATRRLRVAILLAVALIGAEVPAPVLADAAGDRLALRLAADAGARLLWMPLAGEPGERSRGRARLAVWRALALDRPGAAARHAIDHLTRPGVRDWGAEGSGRGGVGAHLWRRQARIWSQSRRAAP